MEDMAQSVNPDTHNAHYDYTKTDINGLPARSMGFNLRSADPLCAFPEC